MLGETLKVVSSFWGNATTSSLEGYTAGDKVTVSATPKEGYIFLGWSSDDEDISLQKAETLDGEWEKAATETVEVDDNGAVFISVAADEKAAFYKFVVPNKDEQADE